MLDIVDLLTSLMSPVFFTLFRLKADWSQLAGTQEFPALWSEISSSRSSLQGRRLISTSENIVLQPTGVKQISDLALLLNKD